MYIYIYIYIGLRPEREVYITSTPNDIINHATITTTTTNNDNNNDHNNDINSLCSAGGLRPEREAVRAVRAGRPGHAGGAARDYTNFALVLFSI